MNLRDYTDEELMALDNSGAMEALWSQLSEKDIKISEQAEEINALRRAKRKLDDELDDELDDTARLSVRLEQAKKKIKQMEQQNRLEAQQRASAEAPRPAPRWKDGEMKIYIPGLRPAPAPAPEPEPLPARQILSIKVGQIGLVAVSTEAHAQAPRSSRTGAPLWRPVQSVTRFGPAPTPSRAQPQNQDDDDDETVVTKEVDPSQWYKQPDLQNDARFGGCLD